MTVTFSCTCGKKLQVIGDHTGRGVRCPNCNTILVVPRQNPYESPRIAETTSGEADSDSKVGKIVARDVLGAAEMVLKRDFGLLFGTAFFFVFVADGITSVFQYFTQPEKLDWSIAAAILFCRFLFCRFLFCRFLFCRFLFCVVFNIAWVRINLNVARGKEFEIFELFRGGWLYPAVFFSTLVLYLAVALGTVLLVIPGLLIAIHFWPAKYFIVDREYSVIDAFKISYQCCRVNKREIAKLVGWSILISLLSLLCCCIGKPLAVAFLGMVWTIAYLKMSRSDFGW